MPVFRTVQSVSLGCRAGQIAGGSPSFFERTNGLGQTEVGLDALPGPVEPHGVFMLHISAWYAQKPQVHDLILCIAYDQTSHVL